MNDLPPAHPSMPGGSAHERYSILLSRLVASGQWDRALDAARDWLAEDPEAAPAHRVAAQALVNLQRYKLASPHLQKVLSVNPDDGFTHRLASIANFHQGRYDRADKCIQRALSLQPEDAMHWCHLAWMRYRHGSRAAALKYARKALAFAPNHPDILNLIALCERVEPPQQLARYQRALELDPENAAVHNNVGAYYINAQGDYSRAIEAFRQALALDPTDKTAQRNLLAALQARDPIYRALTAPARLLGKSRRETDKPGLPRVLTKFFLTSCLSYVLFPVGLLWLVFVLPFAKAYAFLLLRDVQAQAGLVGARRGGWLGFWRWPRWVRVGLLFAVYAACWASVLRYLCHHLPSLSELPPFLYDERLTR